MIYIRKTPNEAIPHTVDVSNLLPDGDSVNSVTSLTATDEDGNDATSDLLGSNSIDGDEITFNSKAIAAGTYSISLKFDTADGYDLEELLEMKVIAGG